MRIRDDDEIYDVDQTYLGPPGRYIGRFRYRAIAIWPMTFFIGVAALVYVGAGKNWFLWAAWALVCKKISDIIIERTSAERPMSVLGRALGHELTADRRPTRGHRAAAPAAFKARRTTLTARASRRAHRTSP